MEFQDVKQMELMQGIKVNKPKELEICQIPVPTEVDLAEVLVKVKAAGICGSDLHIYHGTSPVATYPRVIGHEFVGEIVKVGDGVRNVTVGDHVVVNPVVSCGECYPCTIGRNNICTSLKVRGVHADGGFIQYTVLPEKSVYRIPKDIPWEDAVLMEPFTIAAQIMSRGEITAEDTVLIFGAGPIGLTLVQAVKILGAKCIITDILEEKLELAKKAGADLVINSAKENMAEMVLKETGGLGPTVVVEAVGLPSLFEEGVKLASVAGRVIILGFTDAPSKISQLEITKKELDIRGSRLHRDMFPKVIEWFSNKKVQPGMLVSHKFHFTEVKKAIELIENSPNETCKVVLTFE